MFKLRAKKDDKKIFVISKRSLLGGVKRQTLLPGLNVALLWQK